MATLELLADLTGPEGPPNIALAKFYTPMNPFFGSAAGDGEADDQTALQNCFEHAGENGGVVIIDRPYGFSDELKIYGGMEVWQIFPRRLPYVDPALETPPGEMPIEPGLLALADTAWIRYGDGADGSGSANDNPGKVRGLCVDGRGIAGGGLGLFVMDANQASTEDLMVVNSIGTGVNVGRSQNCDHWNMQVGGCLGAGVLIKVLVAGQQGAGHNWWFGGHLHDNYVPIEIDANVTDFSGPHDNGFSKTLIETGRLSYGMDNIKAAAWIKAGQTQFDDVNFTFGQQASVYEEDCCVLIDNPTVPGFSPSTIVGFRGGSIGGGTGNGINDGVKIRQSGAYNFVRFADSVAFANCEYEVCIDGINLGAADAVVEFSGTEQEVTGVTGKLRKINGGTANLFYSRRWVGNHFRKPEQIANLAMANPFVIGYEEEAGSRLSFDWNGTIRWGDGTGATMGSILRNGAVFGTTGRFGVGGSFFRSPAIQNVIADTAANVNWETTSYHILAFTVNGADINDFNLVSTTVGAVPADGQMIMLCISASAGVTSTIDWTGSGITWDEVQGAPQPETGKVRYFQIVYRTGVGWFEISRSHYVFGGGGTDDQTAAEVPFTPAAGISATTVQLAIEEVAGDTIVNANNIAANTTAIADKEKKWNYEVLAADFTRNLSTLADVFVGFTPAANKKYEFEVFGIITSDATTTGFQSDFNGPTGHNWASYRIATAASATTETVTHATDWTTLNTATAGLTGTNIYRAVGACSYGAAPAAGSNVRMRARMEGGGPVGPVTMKAGSYMRWREIV